MSDKQRNCHNDAVEKMIGNMTSEMQNDGQYVPLGFTSSPNVTERINWVPPTNSYRNYGVQYPDPRLGHPSRDQFQQNPLNFIHPSASMFEPVVFQKSVADFDMYKSNNVPEPLYNNYMPQNVISDNVLHEPQPRAPNHTQLIENLVGNWMVPNNSGTYSPFGSPETFKANMFEFQNNHGDYINEQANDLKFQKITETSKDDKFNFNREKPKIVAEVKPMRPSYSDVLTKPVPSNLPKPTKTDQKDPKTRKENKKNAKIDKSQKISSLLNRSNTNNDIKDIPNEKFLSSKSEKKIKPNQLNRKWASLDNISEPSSNKTEDGKKKKQEENVNKPTTKPVKAKINKTIPIIVDPEPEISKTETYNITKNNLKKSSKVSLRHRQNESQNANDRPPVKRTPRSRKKDCHVPFSIIQQKIQFYTKGWWKVITTFVFWLFHLISDICSLSLHISRDLALNSWSWVTVTVSSAKNAFESVLKKWKFSAWIWKKFKGNKKGEVEDEANTFLHNGLDANINMPTTGDEAMKRLLACKGKDPYSILGVTPTCSDDDIKKYYKRQAFLVHPDKNGQPGAEEAFKILVHAFDMIGTPERREAYDRGVAESAFVIQNFSEIAELIQKLHQKLEMTANTIRCSACGDRHKRSKVDRPIYAARNCNMCRIHHAAREGDIWAEARCFGFLWHYYACMEGSVYDITDWAGCQKETLKHLKPDCHHVQYRIALGKQNSQPRRNSSSPRMNSPDLENLLNSLYGHNENSTSKRRNKNRK